MTTHVEHRENLGESHKSTAKHELDEYVHRHGRWARDAGDPVPHRGLAMSVIVLQQQRSPEDARLSMPAQALAGTDGGCLAQGNVEVLDA